MTINKIHLTEHEARKNSINKMNGFTSINVSVKLNPFCMDNQKCEKSICSKCYAKRVYSNMEKRFIANTDIMTADNFVPEFINRTIIRLHSFGELYSEIHFQNIIKLCNHNTQTRFVLWTKRPNIVNAVLLYTDKPVNLTLIFSSPMMNIKAELPDNFDKTFTVYDKKFIAENDIEINCMKQCNECMKCYNVNNIDDIKENLK